MVVELYDVGVAVIGLALLGVGVLPRFIDDRAISMPIFFVGFGMAIFSLPVVPFVPAPLEQGEATERLVELGVVIALMTLGLKIDRPPGLTEWTATWRLLVITMPLSIIGAALLGWWAIGLIVPTAVLLGTVIAPTDPVLASEVQVEEPGEGGMDEDVPPEHSEQEVRFALSSEAGLNDGLAFPFTNLAIAIALVGLAPARWFGEWLFVDVGYKIVVGTFVGVVAGWVLARLIFATVPDTQIAQSVRGIEAIGGTLAVYGLTEAIGAYGFIGVFVAALMIRNYERSHEYNRPLHRVAELSEQVMMALIMVFFGGAIVGGLFTPLTIESIAVAVAIVFVVRPAAGLLGLLGFERHWSERVTIAFFGVRGIGSFYYLAYALNAAPFPDADLVWAVVGAVVLLSVVVHGITATPVISAIVSE